MLYAYIGVVIAAVLLIAIVAMAVRLTAQIVGKSIREKSFTLVAAYDELLEERGQRLAALEEEIKNREGQLAEHRPAAAVSVSRAAPAATAPAALLTAAERMAAASYRDGSVGTLYQEIRSGFSYDLPEVLEKIPGLNDKPEKGPATSILEELSGEIICALATLPHEQQYALLEESLTEIQRELLRRYAAEQKTFDSLHFYDFLREEADREPKAPVIRLAPGAAVEYEAPAGMRVMEDPDICEGIQVEAGNVLYDYSIRIREIS